MIFFKLLHDFERVLYFIMILSLKWDHEQELSAENGSQVNSRQIMNKEEQILPKEALEIYYIKTTRKNCTLQN